MQELIRQAIELSASDEHDRIPTLEIEVMSNGYVWVKSRPPGFGMGAASQQFSGSTLEEALRNLIQHRSKEASQKSAQPQQESPLTPSGLLKRGGIWLAAARVWLQRNKSNGSHVTWGSNDVIMPHMTARDVEQVVAEAVAADRKTNS